MILHTVSRSPFNSDALQSCLRACKQDAVLLLIEEGSYAAIESSEFPQQILQRVNRVYVLSADACARGLFKKTDPRIPLASDDDFVQLSTECDAVVSWY